MFGNMKKVLLGVALFSGVMDGNCSESEVSTTDNSERLVSHRDTLLSQKISPVTDEQKYIYKTTQRSKDLFKYKSNSLIDQDSVKKQLFTSLDTIKLCNELEREFQKDNCNIEDYTGGLIILIDSNCKNIIDSARQLVTYNEWVAKNGVLAKLWMEVLIKLGEQPDDETEARINALYDYQK